MGLERVVSSNPLPLIVRRALSDGFGVDLPWTFGVVAPL
jgi:hypothetical protein